MSEEAKEEASDDKAAPASAPADAVKSQPEAAGQANRMDIRQEMFGGKVKKAAPPNTDKPKEPGEEPENTTEAKESDAASNDKATPSQKRIQELAREKNAEREMRLKLEEYNRQLIEELNQLKNIKDEEKTPREQIREIMLENTLAENQKREVEELSKYRLSLPEAEAEEFAVNYNYYIPILTEKDPHIMEFIGAYPQKYAMIDMLAKTINSGQFTLEQWINAPVPVKYKKVQELARFVSMPPEERSKYVAPRHNAAPPPPPPKKDVPDSIVPNLKSKLDVEDGGPKEPGYFFRKAFNKT